MSFAPHAFTITIQVARAGAPPQGIWTVDYAPSTPIDTLREAARSFTRYVAPLSGPNVITAIWARRYVWENEAYPTFFLRETYENIGNAFYTAQGFTETWFGWAP